MFTLKVLLLIFVALLLIYNVHNLIRNHYVCKYRIALIYSDYAKYKTLPSYNYMLYRRPFVWDFDKFLPS